MSTKSVTVVVLTALMAFTVACDSELDDQTAAENVEPRLEEAATDEDEAEEDEVQTRTVAFDVESSTIDWLGAKVTGDHDGGFNDWKGTAELAEDNSLHKVEFEVDTRSIWSDDDDLTEHLKSEDFFEVETYPTATFVSEEIREGYDGDHEGATHTIVGDMTIKESTNTISFPAALEATDEALTATSNFTLMRFDYGIEFEGRTDDLIRDEVLMKLDFTVPLTD